MPTDRDKQYMRLAIEQATQGIWKGQTPFGACLVVAGTVVSQAHNGVWRAMDITAHAEILAIREACRRLQTVHLAGATLYSTCEPCPMCFSACHWAKVARIVFGVRIRDAKALGFNELAVSNGTMKRLGKSLLKIEGGCLREENRALFRTWAQRKDRRLY